MARVCSALRSNRLARPPRNARPGTSHPPPALANFPARDPASNSAGCALGCRGGPAPGARYRTCPACARRKSRCPHGFCPGLPARATPSLRSGYRTVPCAANPDTHVERAVRHRRTAPRDCCVALSVRTAEIARPSATGSKRLICPRRVNSPQISGCARPLCLHLVHLR
jgi:hypothetical protein